MARKKSKDYFVCPHCGAQVRSGARACPECGSDEATGWAEDADKWAADIPAGYGGEDDFDYEDFVRREFGGGPGRFFGLPRWVLFPLIAAVLAGLIALL